MSPFDWCQHMPPSGNYYHLDTPDDFGRLLRVYRRLAPAGKGGWDVERMRRVLARWLTDGTTEKDRVDLAKGYAAALGARQ